MKFSEFKIAVEGATTGDKKLPDNDKLIPLTNEAMKMVARKSHPLTLITNDIRDDILVHVDDENYFIRKPKLIEDDESVLDIDEELHFAVVYQTAMLFGHRDNKAYYKALMSDVQNDFAWTRYQTLEGVDADA